MEFSAKEFGASFKGFMEQMASQGPVDDPVFVRRLRDHFQCEPATLPVVTERFETYDHPNLHTAIESYLAEPGWSVEIAGITGHQKYMGVSLADLVAPGSAALMGGAAATEGPVEYINIALDGDRVLTCVQCGLFFAKKDAERLAILVHGAGGFRLVQKVTVEVMAREKKEAERFLSDLRLALRKRNVYRGHVLSVDQDETRVLKIKFHQLPRIERQNIILPQGLLERIERQTIHFSRHSQKLLAAGRHLKRGLLLFGAPGTGKTLTAMYLASAIRDRTVLLLTGRGLSLLEQSCSLARALQPSIVILEDVDLVAEERTQRPSGCAQPLLFELLNEMDGLADDADVLFLLTTNRADLLEPALAARPGRIDQSFEIPLPDASCRTRLFDLYGRGLALQVRELARFIERTDGASAAFIRELMRKAALFAADEGEQLVVSDRHLDEALHELLVEGGELTKSLLGFRAGKYPRNSER
ncbi:MAG TPA: AAA family ATPase [Gemmataceae bacterium]|jgi:ATP-dependent 26S proteasome regulatory subunit|nr:AAA family ATPase [Gemmataceae bacterium]